MDSLNKWGLKVGSPYAQYVDMICTACGHCQTGPICDNCEMRGRVRTWTRPRMSYDSVPTPLFFELKNGNLELCEL